jgi:hypothetical protein
MDGGFDILIFMLVLAGLFTAGSVPLILQKIPPNGWYGCTKKSCRFSFSCPTGKVVAAEREFCYPCRVSRT